jgi:hypothetical protein
MPFFIGDDNGNIKRLVPISSDGALKLICEDDLAGGSKGKQRAVQSMAFATDMVSIRKVSRTNSIDFIRKASSFSC